MQYSIEDINTIVNGTLTGSTSNSINTLLIDSRKLTNASQSLFFAIKGDRHDGHRFIKELYEKGIRSFIVNQLPEYHPTLTGASFVKTNDTLLALQKIAAHHRSRFKLPVIGITGSNGKTIVKEWLYQLMRDDKNIVRSPRSFNSQVGVPLSIWQIEKEHTLGIFEAGISLPGEMFELEKMIKPTIGIFTNIGQAHDENFKSPKQKIAEKLKLFAHAEVIIYNKDYTAITDEIAQTTFTTGTRFFTWSKKSKADLQIGRVYKENNQTQIQGVYNNDFLSITIPFTDEASIENTIHCWATMLFLGYENKVIAQRVRMLSQVAMRLEMKEGINNCSVINDSYNSDLASLSVALDFLNQQKQHVKKTLILSDILQSGRDEQSLYTDVARLVKDKGVTHLIGIGEALTRQQHLFSGEKQFFPSTPDFINAFNSSLFRDETILLKGARPFSFEDISRLLQLKAHETVLEINLNALIHNLNYYKSKLNPGVKLMAMVKAFSYGSGSFEIANVLQFHRIDYLAVAYADEGVELRKAGIHVPIMVMNPEEQSYDSMIQYNLEPEIFSFRILNKFDESIKRNSRLLKQAFPIHIKLDTGMHRLGFEEKDINELIVRISNNKLLQIRSVFSHLAGSDEQEHDSFTVNQINKFNEMSDAIISKCNYPVIKHISNSAGISRFPQAQLNMVRLGIGMYGIGSTVSEQAQLENVSTLKTTISQIKNIKAGESIGYSRKYVAPSDMQIATVPIGYADGLNRRLSNGKGSMMVKDKLAQIVGNVCMDMCMINVTGTGSNEGDEVIVFGDEYTISDQARDLGTIPYEVLTNVSRRVKRVYYHE